jgi:hypothetical protein
MKPLSWMQDLHALAARLAHLGVTADLGCLTVAELWGVYLFLQRQLSRPEQTTGGAWYG